MYLSFEGYLYKVKKNFQAKRYEEDGQYRAVLFHQFSTAYQAYCKEHQLASDYALVAYEVRQFEKRVEVYRNT